MYSIVNNDEWFTMPETTIHDRIIGALFYEFMDVYKNDIKGGKIMLHTKNMALVYYGDLKNKSSYWYSELVELDKIKDMDDFITSGMSDLNFMQPDVMMFDKDNYLTNKKKTKVAGIPFFVAEVWSESNSSNEKQVKFELYSKYDALEHWYIEQDSDIIRCFKGSRELPSQNIRNKLTTSNDVEMDISYAL